MSLCEAFSYNGRMTLIPIRQHALAMLIAIGPFALVLSGCKVDAPTSNAPPPSAITPFSTATVPGSLPTEWHYWTIHKQKNPTSYRPVYDGSDVVIAAKAFSSASGYLHPLAPLNPNQILQWRWKTANTIPLADNTVAHLEDAPLRILVAFDGDVGKLPLKDQLAADMVKLTTGYDMPYATLMYVWGNKKAVDSVLNHPHSGRVKMIVVEAGTSHINQWRHYQRDVAADFRRAYGEEPEKLIGVGILTDTDNTKSAVTAWYGDISLRAKESEKVLSR